MTTVLERFGVNSESGLGGGGTFGGYVLKSVKPVGRDGSGQVGCYPATRSTSTSLVLTRGYGTTRAGRPKSY